MRRQRSCGRRSHPTRRNGSGAPGRLIGSAAGRGMTHGAIARALLAYPSWLLDAAAPGTHAVELSVFAWECAALERRGERSQRREMDGQCLRENSSTHS